MSSADNSFPDFGKLVPGFDFLQNLTKQATSATQNMPQMPNLGSWIAPTMNVEELDKRITELKAVQFWLDQNGTALKATIQALEVQKMTLATLKGMNVNMSEMANAFTMKMADMTGQGGNGHQAGNGKSAGKSGGGSGSKGHEFAGLEVPETSYQKREGRGSAQEGGGGSGGDESEAQNGQGGQTAGAGQAASALTDPMQWWGSLTQQFQTIAANAMKDVAAKSPLDPAQGFAAEAMNKATELAGTASKTVAESMEKSASTAREAMDTALRGASSWTSPAPAKKARPASAKAAPAKKKAPAKTAASAKTTSAARKGSARTR